MSSEHPSAEERAAKAVAAVHHYDFLDAQVECVAAEIRSAEQAAMERANDEWHAACRRQIELEKVSGESALSLWGVVLAERERSARIVEVEGCACDPFGHALPDLGEHFSNCPLRLAAAVRREDLPEPIESRRRSPE